MMNTELQVILLENHHVFKQFNNKKLNK